MINRNIEDIDKLFREGLNPEENPVAFQEGDWSKLQQRLDRHERNKRGIFWLSRLSGVAALILLFFALWTLLPEGSKQVIQQAEVQQKEQKSNNEQKPSIASQGATNRTGKTEPDSNKLLAQNKTIKEKGSEKRFNIQTIGKKTVHQDTLGVDIASQGATKIGGKAEPDSNKSLAQNKTIKERLNEKQPNVQTVEKKTAHQDTLGIENLSIKNSPESPRANSKEQHPSLPETGKSSNEKRSSVKEEPLYATIEEPNDQLLSERAVRKLALSILAAPDYNGVNNLNNASLGNDFGLMVSYKVAKNWSFSTGGIYAKKIYETGFNNYTPTKNIWTNYYPKSVSADCRVLDIPLNISYTLLKGKNYTISAGTGMSSYMMLKEDYRFTYAETDTNIPLTYSAVNENKHWLSVLNLQASIEQRLSSRISIGLQPYMKIPLRNIGFAGVKLQSFGVAANLSWNFNL